MEDKKEQWQHDEPAEIQEVWQHDEPAEVQEIWQHEDAALKTSMQFFAEELLPLFGITQKAVGIAPTELVPLTLCLLMGGEMPQKERVMKAYSITQSVQSEDKEVVQKIEPVLYAMADKFLEPAELQEIVEAISMTRLGQMLVDKGMKEGMKEGREEEKLSNARNLIDLLDAETIAERIGLPLETVQKIKRESNKETI